MPEPQEYSIFRNWPLVRKALSVFETRDWFSEYRTIINAIDADVNALMTGAALPAHAPTHDTGGSDPLTDILAAITNLTDIDGALANSVQDYVDTVQGKGWVSGSAVTDNGDGTVDVAAGVAMMKTAAAKGSPTGFIVIPATASVALTDNDTNFIYVDYNAGTPVIAVTLLPAFQSDEDKVSVNVVYRQGTTLHIADFDHGLQSLQTILSQKATEEAAGRGFTFAERADGIMIGNPSALYLSLTSGSLWGGLKRKATGAFDTSGTDTFSLYYRDGVGGYTEVASQTQIPNNKYDDGSGTPASVAVNRYAVHWLYLDFSSTDLSVVYSQDEYTLADAEQTTPPSLIPNFVSEFSMLVGRMIVFSGASTFDPESPWGDAFGATGVASHTALSDVNAAAEVQHLTAAEQTVVLAPRILVSSLGGTGLLLVTDPERIIVTGTALNYEVQLPSAAAAPLIGKTYQIHNSSSQPIYVVSFSRSGVGTTLNPGQALQAVLTANSVDGTWVVGRFAIPEATLKEPTGFIDPEDVIVTYDSTTRKITLTGTVEAYYNGLRVIPMVVGWESDAHSVGATSGLFLYFDGSAFTWSTSAWDFDDLQIAFVCYDSGGTYKFALRETHGMQPWETHRNLHEAIGTYRTSGGDLGGYVLDSTTAADRRPTISEAKIRDEDLESTVAAHTSGNNYSHAYLSGAGGDVDFTAAQNDIVDVTGITPVWNEYTGGAWTKTALGNNDFMSVWLVAFPAAADSDSQAMRLVWMAGQDESTRRAAQRALSPSDLELSGLGAISPEFVFIEQVIIRETGAGDWKIVEVIRLTGTKATTVSTSTGGFLSAVSTDESLSGTGTAADPLTGRTPSTDVAVAAYTVLATDRALNVAVGALCEITIPTTEIAKDGRMLRISNTGGDATTYMITIVGQAGELINGGSEYEINGDDDSIDIEMKGTYAWVV